MRREPQNPGTPPVWRYIFPMLGSAIPWECYSRPPLNLMAEERCFGLTEEEIGKALFPLNCCEPLSIGCIKSEIYEHSFHTCPRSELRFAPIAQFPDKIRHLLLRGIHGQIRTAHVLEFGEGRERLVPRGDSRHPFKVDFDPVVGQEGRVGWGITPGRIGQELGDIEQAAARHPPDGMVLGFDVVVAPDPEHPSDLHRSTALLHYCGYIPIAVAEWTGFVGQLYGNEFGVWLYLPCECMQIRLRQTGRPNLWTYIGHDFSLSEADLEDEHLKASTIGERCGGEGAPVQAPAPSPGIDGGCYAA
jgi:hypothetical protein